MAYASDVAPQLVRSVLARMSAQLPEAISNVIVDERLLEAKRNFLRENMLFLIEERRGFVADAVRFP